MDKKVGVVIVVERGFERKRDSEKGEERREQPMEQQPIDAQNIKQVEKEMKRVSTLERRVAKETNQSRESV